MRILRPPELRFLLLSAALLGGAGFAVGRQSGWRGRLRTAPAIVVMSAPVRHVADTLRRNETLSQLFGRRGVTDVDWNAVASAVRVFDPRRVRAGTVFTFAQRHGEDEPHAVAVRVSYEERLRLVRTAGDGVWAPVIERIPWRSSLFVIDGRITTSVSDAITESIGDDILPRASRISLVDRLAEVYDWVVDFSREVQPGDRFRVLAERMTSAEGEVRFERVLAAKLEVGPKPLYAFRLDAPDGRPEFYDQSGRSMKRDLLRAPLTYRRIASGFSRSRFHPILRYRRPHNGIDFSAAYGAPVRAVGDGTVSQAGRAGGYGNLVEIHHAGGRISRYAHLSGFARDVHAGARVAQGQTIGYVGASGLATSAHLHYELLVGGRFVNPRRDFLVGAGRPIAPARRQLFEGEKTRLLDLLEPGTPATMPVARVD